MHLWRSIKCTLRTFYIHTYRYCDHCVVSPQSLVLYEPEHILTCPVCYAVSGRFWRAYTSQCHTQWVCHSHSPLLLWLCFTQGSCHPGNCCNAPKSSTVVTAAYMVRDFLREGNDDVKVNEEVVGRLTGILVRTPCDIPTAHTTAGKGHAFWIHRDLDTLDWHRSPQ